MGPLLNLRSAMDRLHSAAFYSSGQQWILLTLALLIVGLFVLKFHIPSASTSTAGPSREFIVEVAGEADRPGILVFRHPPTLPEVLAKAGGGNLTSMKEDGLASEALRTGTLLTVARTSEGNLWIHVGRMEARKLLIFFIPLDLNRVTVDDLCLVPGVGESLAREMIAYREQRKGFRTLQELRQVRGIGETKAKALQTYLTVS